MLNRVGTNVTMTDVLFTTGKREYHKQSWNI